jgi:hypothetical protein
MRRWVGGGLSEKASIERPASGRSGLIDRICQQIEHHDKEACGILCVSARAMLPKQLDDGVEPPDAVLIKSPCVHCMISWQLAISCR